jgi:hypothetical protein
MRTSIACDDPYIGSITLENQKDRSVTIFKVFLKLGHNYFIEIDDFKQEPLILKPFEVFHKDYDPIDLYTVNTNKIEIAYLLKEKRIKRQIVLSTSEGRYNVKAFINHWDPVTTFFKNHMTGIVRPMRSTFKGKSYGINAKYVLDLKYEKGVEEVVAIYPRDFEIKKFRNFQLTKESLESKDALEEFLLKQFDEGVLNCVDFTVYDMETWLSQIYEQENKEPLKALSYNWFIYYIIGPILTKFDDFQLWKKNKALKKANSQLEKKSNRNSKL